MAGITSNALQLVLGRDNVIGSVPFTQYKYTGCTILHAYQIYRVVGHIYTIYLTP